VSVNATHDEEPVDASSAAAAAERKRKGKGSQAIAVDVFKVSVPESCFCNAWRRTAGVYGDCRKAARKDARLGTGLGSNATRGSSGG
jgi:hypothetical protein